MHLFFGQVIFFNKIDVHISIVRFSVLLRYIYVGLRRKRSTRFHSYNCGGGLKQGIIKIHNVGSASEVSIQLFYIHAFTSDQRNDLLLKQAKVTASPSVNRLLHITNNKTWISLIEAVDDQGLKVL